MQNQLTKELVKNAKYLLKATILGVRDGIQHWYFEMKITRLWEDARESAWRVTGPDEVRIGGVIPAVWHSLADSLVEHEAEEMFQDAVREIRAMAIEYEAAQEPPLLGDVPYPKIC